MYANMRPDIPTAEVRPRRVQHLDTCPWSKSGHEIYVETSCASYFCTANILVNIISILTRWNPYRLAL